MCKQKTCEEKRSDFTRKRNLSLDHNPLLDSEGDTSTIIHRACRYFSRNKSIMEMALQMNSQNLCVPLERLQSNSHRSKRERPLFEQLSGYPLHIALANNPSFEIVKMIVNKDIDTLRVQDSNGLNALMVALKHKISSDIIDFMISKYDEIVKTCDNRCNFPLHHAVKYYSSGEAIQKLVDIFPLAVKCRNRNGKTPLDLLYTLEKCDDKILSLLQNVIKKDTPMALEL